MVTGPTLERRDSPRVAADVAAHILLCDNYGSLPARTCDVGLGGFCVETRTSVSIGEIRGVELRFDGGIAAFSVRARWQRFAQIEQAWHTGLQCQGVGSEQAQQLNHLVRESSDEIVKFLRAAPVLGDLLTFDELNDLALCTRVRHARAGSYIWRGGRFREAPTARDSIFVLRSGVVMIQPDERSTRRICLDQIREGVLFGGIGLLTELTVPLVAIAGEDCVLFEVDGGSFGYLERSRPKTAERLRELVVDRLTTQFSEVIRHVASA